MRAGGIPPPTLSEMVEIGWQVAPCWVSEGSLFIICICQMKIPGLQGPLQMANMLFAPYCIVFTAKSNRQRPF